MHRTQAYSVPTSESARAQTANLVYQFEVLVDDKTDRLAVGVLDEISHDFGLETIEVSNRVEPQLGNGTH